MNRTIFNYLLCRLRSSIWDSNFEYRGLISDRLLSLDDGHFQYLLERGNQLLGSQRVRDALEIVEGLPQHILQNLQLLMVIHVTLKFQSVQARLDAFEVCSLGLDRGCAHFIIFPKIYRILFSLGEAGQRS